MKFSISKDAAKWYIDEMGLEPGDYVQFFVKLYGGIKTAHPSYFLGVSRGVEGDIAVKQEVEGVTFYFNKQDEWFLDEFDMKVEMGEEEAKFTFE